MTLLTSGMRHAKRVLGLLQRSLGRLTAYRKGLVRMPPCYYLRPLAKGSVVLDCGLGDNADFSVNVGAQFGSVCYGIDPTAKHAQNLRALETGSNGTFHFFPMALSGTSGHTRFYESEDQISGSMFSTHVNVTGGSVNTYDVECIRLMDAAEVTGVNRFDLIKLDVEGAEYEILDSASDEWLTSIPQLIIEFHHETVAEWGISDTQRQIGRLRRLGFEMFSADGQNFLFYR